MDTGAHWALITHPMFTVPEFIAFNQLTDILNRRHSSLFTVLTVLFGVCNRPLIELSEADSEIAGAGTLYFAGLTTSA